MIIRDDQEAKIIRERRDELHKTLLQIVVEAGLGLKESNNGILYTVKGKLVEGNAIEFDFHEVLYREVKACKPDIYRKKGKAKKPAKSSAQAVKRSGSMAGFTMPGMGSAIGGMY